MLEGMLMNFVFDIGNVILNFDPKKFLYTLTENEQDADALYETIFASKEWIMLDKGTITPEGARRRFVKSRPELESLINAVMENWVEMLTPVEETIDFLKEVREQGHSLYFLSNFHKSAADYVKRKYDFFDNFDGGVFSFEVKKVKPSSEIFERLLEKYELKAADCIFIDDVKENVETAEEMGMRGLQFTTVDDIRELYQMEYGAKESFNRLSGAYERRMGVEQVPFDEDYERTAMTALLPENIKDMNILDAGCGSGFYSQHFLSEGAAVTALDVSEKMLEMTKQRTGARAKTVLHDLHEELPFKNNSFHMILCSLTLHYLHDWETVFSEFHRVLKPGGLLLISVPHPFMNMLRWEHQNYFTRNLLTNVWERDGETVEVQFYHRPVASLINMTTKYFRLTELVEPNRNNDYIISSPQFLLVSAIKG